MKSLQQLMADHPEAFREAIRESEQTLSRLETALDVKLSTELRWFWLHCGSGDSGAAPSAEASISDTLRYRKAVGLPSRYLVLDDRNDAGSVFLDTTSGAVAWVNYHAVSAFAHGEIKSAEREYFPSFFDWVERCLELNSD